MPEGDRELSNLDRRILSSLRGEATKRLREGAAEIGVTRRPVQRRYDRTGQEGSFIPRGAHEPLARPPTCCSSSCNSSSNPGMTRPQPRPSSTRIGTTTSSLTSRPPRNSATSTSSCSPNHGRRWSDYAAWGRTLPTLNGWWRDSSGGSRTTATRSTTLSPNVSRRPERKGRPSGCGVTSHFQTPGSSPGSNVSVRFENEGYRSSYSVTDRLLVDQSSPRTQPVNEMHDRQPQSDGWQLEATALEG